MALIAGSPAASRKLANYQLNLRSFFEKIRAAEKSPVVLAPK